MGPTEPIPTTAESESRLKWALAFTGSFLAIEIAGGLWTGSLALLSDAAHMMTDAAALIVAIVAIRVGGRAADQKRTYGYKRFEILAAAFNAALLFLVAFYILYEAYQRFKTPPQIEANWMLAIASAGLVINFISMGMLKKSSEHSLNVKGAYLDVLSDLISSVGVILAAVIIKMTGWWQVDPILAVIIGFWILPRTWTLFSETVNILLEGVPAGIDMKKLYADLSEIAGVSEVHEVHVWAITSGVNSVTAHLLVKTSEDMATILDKAQSVAKSHSIEHSNFQIEESSHAANLF